MVVVIPNVVHVATAVVVVTVLLAVLVDRLLGGDRPDLVRRAELGLAQTDSSIEEPPE